MILESGNEKDNNTLELVRAHFASSNKDFITAEYLKILIALYFLRVCRRYRKCLHRLGAAAHVKDFITAVDENNVIAVKELTEADAQREIEKAAGSLESFLQLLPMSAVDATSLPSASMTHRSTLAMLFNPSIVFCKI